MTKVFIAYLMFNYEDPCGFQVFYTEEEAKEFCESQVNEPWRYEQGRLQEHHEL